MSELSSDKKNKNGNVVRKYDARAFGTVASTVVGVRDVQELTQHTTLRGTSVSYKN